MRITRLQRVVYLGVAALIASTLGACGASKPPPAKIGEPGPAVAVEDTSGGTQVAVLGTLHGVHLGSRAYSLDVIEKTLRGYGPQIVLVEIPPDRFEAAVQEVDALPDRKIPPGKIKDEWLRAFPELYNVVIPLRKELGYEMIPVSGWTPLVSKDRQAYWKAHPKGPKSARYREKQASFAQAFRDNRGAENPGWINGEAYAKLSGEMYEALSESAEKDLGEAGVKKINEEHWAHVHRALEDHAGQRILLVYGALHRWFLEPRIRALPSVRFIDVAAFIPTS